MKVIEGMTSLEIKMSIGRVLEDPVAVDHTVSVDAVVVVGRYRPDS